MVVAIRATKGVTATHRSSSFPTAILVRGVLERTTKMEVPVPKVPLRAHLRPKEVLVRMPMQAEDGGKEASQGLRGT